MALIDVSVGLAAEIPIWPGSPGVEVKPLLQRARGDVANASELRMDVHSGTHVDAPRHFVDDGVTVESLPLDPLSGRALVAGVRAQARAITAGDLRAALGNAAPERLLLRTGNSEHPDLYSTPFREDYCALAPDGAAWVRDRGIGVIGIDYLSIQRYTDPPDSHEILLQAGIPIIEGLNLSAVSTGWYEMLCLPILLIGAEAAPARVALRPLPEV